MSDEPMADKPDENAKGWGRGTWTGLVVAAFVLYVLSLGPATSIVNATGQRWIFALYMPLMLAAYVCPPLEHALDWYANLWLTF
jgi:hypothetical protein